MPAGSPLAAGLLLQAVGGDGGAVAAESAPSKAKSISSIGTGRPVK